MPKYACIFSYSTGSWARMLKTSDDGLSSFRRLLDSVGGSLETVYWMPLGIPSGMVIVDTPDSVTAAAVSVAVTSTGAVQNLQTYELFTQEQVGEMLLMARDGTHVYRPPGHEESIFPGSAP
ncbi:MAG TPA: GYD domain-containing protein [Streptosporangiaceae bacterium]|jgi:uncharacterized protein with GYD domain|nr:GYD domain-containing protein [Streptosporangiaceae bacterium]